MLYIKNIKTAKTASQINDEWKKAEAYRNSLLASTDWTQLPDVGLCNIEEYVKWRKDIRAVDLKKMFENASDAEEYIKTLESTKPEPVLSTIGETGSENRYEKLQNELKELNVLVHQLVSALKEPNISESETIIDRKKSIPLIIDFLMKEKNEKLIQAGVLTFPILISQMDQAIDFLSREDSTLDSYSVLHNNTDSADREYVQAVIDNFKEKRKELYEIDRAYLQKQQNVYNMSIEEVNNYFIENGHRYRCVE